MSNWNKNRSLFWQLVGGVVAWCYPVFLHWKNDGLWYQGDAPRHAANGAFWLDLFRNLPLDPQQFALSYYARYPVITPTAYPPVFYWLEALAYQVLGVSPFVAKGVVLAFVLLGTFYLIAWLRDAIDEQAGWLALLFPLQPGIIVWGHAVMLNLPYTVLGLAALYHWRQWLDSQSKRQLYLASALGLLTGLTHFQALVVVAIMAVWLLVSRKSLKVVQGRTLAVGLGWIALLGLCIVLGVNLNPVYAWGVAQGGDHPWWRMSAWTWYPSKIFYLISVPLLVAAFGGIALAGYQQRWRRDVLLAVLWIGIPYAFFSALSVKDERFALVTVPAFLWLAGIGVLGCVRWMREKIGRYGRLVPAVVLGGLLVWHAAVLPSIKVPEVAGFAEIVAFVTEDSSSPWVFYDGYYDGVFSYYLRANDSTFSRGVVRGSKLLYATKIYAKWGVLSLVSSPADVGTRLRTHCGCRLLVVERQMVDDVPAVAYLREALQGEEFRLVRSFRVRSPLVQDVDVYEYLGPLSRPENIELPFPILGNGSVYKVQPIEQRH